jgi:tripeptidyl-peptidase-1
VINSGGEFGLVGGTSASSPTVASIIAIINDRLGALGRPRLGFLNRESYLSEAAHSTTELTAP